MGTRKRDTRNLEEVFIESLIIIFGDILGGIPSFWGPWLESLR